MRLKTLLAGLVIAVFGAIGAAAAAAPGSDKIAIVLLHGGGSSGSQFDDLRPIVEKAGYRVVTPDMCWAQSRRYDKGAPACMADVDKAIDRLKAEGYQRIVVGGHSQGGLFAIYYAANHKGLAGVVVFAPGGPPVGMDSNNLMVAYAHRLVKEGKGDVVVNFGGGINEIFATPDDYLSWTSIESPLYDIELLPKFTAPILWVAGTQDPGQRNAPDRYKYAAANPLNAFVTVEADHFATPDVGVNEMIKWLDRLAAAKATD
jgi:pimeloyl-ACP methyl ester carboxylesterase